MMLAGAAACCQHQPAGGRLPTPTGSVGTGLVADLRKSGFQVNPGYVELYTQKECTDYTYPVLKNCLANNPAAPYVAPIVKTWPDEYVDPAAVNAFGKVPSGYTGTYRLDPRDAIVVYGEMPPPGRYMSLQTWEFSQNGRWSADTYAKWEKTADRPVPMQYLFDTIPPGSPRSGRTQSVSALGDTVNNVVMERHAGYSFGKNRYFIVTPSATTDHEVRQSLQAQGVPSSDIFTEQIPSSDPHGPIGPLGMASDAIDFVSAFRYAVPDAGQEAAAAEWRAHPPLKVLRLRAPESLGPVQRYGALTFGPRTATSEAYLSGDLNNLLDAVCCRSRTAWGPCHSDECSVGVAGRCSVSGWKVRGRQSGSACPPAPVT
jgi:hypothetical protein